MTTRLATLAFAAAFLACTACSPGRDDPTTTPGVSIESDLQQIESTLDAIESELKGD